MEDDTTSSREGPVRARSHQARRIRFPDPRRRFPDSIEAAPEHLHPSFDGDEPDEFQDPEAWCHGGVG